MIVSGPFKCRWCDEVFHPGESELLARHVMSEHSTQWTFPDAMLSDDEPTEPMSIPVDVIRPAVPRVEMEPLYATQAVVPWSWVPPFLLILALILAITIITGTL